jgi:hypothetical protein
LLFELPKTDCLRNRLARQSNAATNPQRAENSGYALI